MANISQATLELLNMQISNELFNANKYATIGAALKNVGLDNIGSYFNEQNEEEREHADKIRKYITDRNEQVLSLSVPEFSLGSVDIIDIANLYVASEKETTASLTRIALQAFSEQDLLTYNFAIEMLGYQRHEEEETLTFFDKAAMTANAPEVLLLWDANFKI